jgi:hypothetical protein
MSTLGWARSAPGTADVLRRGAWYPITAAPTDGTLEVDVGGRRVRVSVADVRLRSDRPERWSVVVRTGVLRPTLGAQGKELVTQYAVCPHCRQRQDYAGKPATLTCVQCGATSPVDWSETC